MELANASLLDESTAAGLLLMAVVGFLGIEGTEVIILYPKGKVSHIQELQLTTNSNNIKAVAGDDNAGRWDFSRE